MQRHNQTGYKGRINNAIKEFEGKTFEREELIRLIILAIFCRQHIFLFGKPGVGKTYIARLASNLFGAGNYWEILMAHDTKTEQLMGSIKKDESGKTYRDLNDSMLDKPFVFLDEMFKGSNQVLNALLGPMLDRKYIEGGNIFDVPLITLFGASNEFPEGEDIKPFEDRLMFRFDVIRLQDHENRVKYNNGDFDKSPHFNTQFEISEIYFVEEHSNKIHFSRGMLDNYIFLQNAIIKDGIGISDRKFGPDQAGKVFRVSAYLNGRKEVDFSDLMLLRHIAWHNLVDKNKLDEVLINIFFGNEVETETSISMVEENFTRTRGFFEADCLAFINYKKEYVGQSSLEDFKYDLQRLNSYGKSFETILSQADKLAAKKNQAFEIQAQCDKNIFLFGINQPVYTVERISRIETLQREVKTLAESISQWINENDKVFNYNQERAKRMAIVA